MADTGMTSDVRTAENLAEKMGQWEDERRNSRQASEPARETPGRLRADLDTFDLVQVTQAGGVSVSRLYNHSATPGWSKFGELFSGCMGGKQCRAKMLKWLREQTGKARAMVFTIVIPDQRSNHTSQVATFTFRKNGGEVRAALRNSGFVEQGEYVIVGKTFPDAGWHTRLVTKKPAKKKKPEQDS